MKRLALCALVPLALSAQQRRPTFDVAEATIPQMQAALTAGRVTSHELVLLYLARIATYDHT
ncbi:MAG: hypothetical protein ACREN6_08230, partial [Gemmatimonadaceae bacterium]